MDSCHIFYPRPRPRCLSSFTSFLGLRSFQEPDAFPRFHLSQSYSSHFCLRPQHRLSMILSSSSFLRIFFLFLVFLVLNPPLPPGRSWNGTTATDGLSTLFIKFASHTHSSSAPPPLHLARSHKGQPSRLLLLDWPNTSCFVSTSSSLSFSPSLLP